jgi:hypothetical protein
MCRIAVSAGLHRLPIMSVKPPAAASLTRENLLRRLGQLALVRASAMNAADRADSAMIVSAELTIEVG